MEIAASAFGAAPMGAGPFVPRRLVLSSASHRILAKNAAVSGGAIFSGVSVRRYSAIERPTNHISAQGGLLKNPQSIAETRLIKV